jgi:hypothetical protein
MSIRRAASEYGSVVGDQELTVADVAIGCTVPAGAVSAMFTNGAEPVRLRWGTPTASVGHYINPYSVIDLYLDDLTDVKFIRVSSTSTAYVTYFG